jgi:GNAT superfamily N-acetyltransferase
MNEIRIVPLQTSEIDEAADLLSKAFINTPFSGKIMGGHTEKHRKQLKMGFKAMLAKKPGTKVAAMDGDEMVGVMRMVKWPDCQNSIPRGLELIMPTLVARKVMGRLKEARKVWGLHDPKKPHWHVDPIGVLPERQGQGIGQKLMAYYCEHVDSQNMAAYHETDQLQNVRFYEKFGYKTLETEPIFGIKNWFLWREPSQCDK